MCRDVFSRLQPKIHPPDAFHITTRNPRRGSTSPFVGYVAAVVATLVALGLTLLLEPYLGRTIAIWFVAAFAVSAWAGGFGPGIIAAVLAVLVLNYFFFTPQRSWLSSDPSELVSLGVFILIATLISSINARLARSRQEAHDEQQ